MNKNERIKHQIRKGSITGNLQKCLKVIERLKKKRKQNKVNHMKHDARETIDIYLKHFSFSISSNSLSDAREYAKKETLKEIKQKTEKDIEEIINDVCNGQTWTPKRLAKRIAGYYRSTHTISKEN